MRLSEAIYKGAQLVPQRFGGLFSYKESGLRIAEREVSAACALGGAILALYGRPQERPAHTVLEEDYPELTVVTQCPVGCKNDELEGSPPHEDDLWNIIAHLNDQHYWTRERIAFWLRTQEK